MTGRIRLASLVALATAVLALGLAACGSSSSKNTTTTNTGGAATGTTGTTTTGSSSASNFKVGLVTDIGGLNDRSFNHLAFVGLTRAEQQLGIKGKVLTSSTGADYLPNLTTLSREGYNLIIPVGFLMGPDLATVAKAFPSEKYAIVDFPAEALKGTPKNVEGLLFKEEQAGYLAGYLAGLYAKEHGYKTISSVGGQKVPAVDHYIAGYQAGAKAADPGIATLNAYSQDFVAQDKCKNIALNQIQQGSKVVFQVAGGCGLGALSAAQQQGVQGIGVDADQSYLGSFILTSAEKKVDNAVFSAIQNAMHGQFSGGSDVINDISNGGVSYGKIGPEGLKFSPQIAKIYSQIKSGQISNIPNTVK